MPPKRKSGSWSPNARGNAASRKNPTVSRRVRACQACRNRKIKCDLDEGQNVCTRCVRLNLECVVNRSLQTLLDDENEWKNDVEAQLHLLRTELGRLQSLCGLSPQPGAGAEQHHDDSPFPSTPTAAPRAHTAAPVVVTAMTRENSPDRLAVNQEPDSSRGDGFSIGSAPAASLFEVTKLRNIRNDPGSSARVCAEFGPAWATPPFDFIDQNRVTLAEAEDLFSAFQTTLNAYLWGGVCLCHDTLSSVRASSRLLTASILAVTALHKQDQGDAFNRCYPIFLELVGQCIFQRYHSLDDVRALCIGAFWLSDVSWKLSGLAVRIATELNLHKMCGKLLLSDSIGPTKDHMDGARLWFFLYLCDHHFSIAYGRPPAIHEDIVITQHEHFLLIPGVTASDYRLHSQVALFLILSRAALHFRPDLCKLVASDEFETMRRFERDLDKWKQSWLPILAPDPDVADYPRKGIILHYHFARLQLFSMCLRGLDPTENFPISSDRRVFINKAIRSAMTALQMILSDADLRRAVIGMPFYLLTSIAYASTFVMRVHRDWAMAEFDISYEGIVHVLQQMVSLLSASSACIKHVAFYTGKGLEAMLHRFVERNNEQGGSQGWKQSGGGGDSSDNVPFWGFAEGTTGSQMAAWDDWTLGGAGLIFREGTELGNLFQFNMP